jgi:hypothetical protein
LSIIP